MPAPRFIAECLERSGISPIHVSFKWDSDDPDYDSPSASVADDDGSVAESDDGDGSSAVDEDGTNQTLSSESDDDDDYGAASHSTPSIYHDHRGEGYSWTACIKEAQTYHCKYV